MLAANNWNVVQYAVLVHMLAQVSGLVPGELVHVIADAHIYDAMCPSLKKMLAQRRPPAPVFGWTRRDGLLRLYPGQLLPGGLHPRPLRGPDPHRYLRRPAL